MTFDPLNLCPSVSPLLQTLSTDAAYASYVPLLQRALLSRLLAQLSQVYSSITLEHLRSLVAPLRSTGGEGEVPAYDDAQVEAYVMGCARRGELAVRVDHAAGSIVFIDDAFSAEPGTSASALRRDGEVQAGTAELVRTRLSGLAGALHTALGTIEPVEVLSEDSQRARLEQLVAAAQAERRALQLRRAVVARRRELAQELAARKEKEAASRRADAARREREAAEVRAIEDQKRRERERTIREIENIRKKEAQDLAESLKARNVLKVKIDVSVSATISVRAILTLWYRRWRT